MVPKNGSDKLIARIVYNGPVRAPIEAGQPIGVVKVWRGANIALEAPVYAAEVGRHRLDHAPRHRRRQRARHRHVPRRAPRSSEHDQAQALKRPTGRGQVHHL